MENIRPMRLPVTTNRFFRPILLVVAVCVVLLVAGAAYIWFSGGSGRASHEIDAPVLALQPGDTRTLFRIAPEQSEVRFRIEEMLLGSLNMVIGKTNQVAGEMLVDFQNPANSLLGAVRINVRTLETDNEIRNRAIRGQVLQSERDELEFAQFVPMTLANLPDHLTVGESAAFQIVGDLSLHGITREIAFDATVTPINQTRLEGTAQASVLYRDFNITIPDAPGVANVSDDVRLEIDFVAQAVSE